MRSLSKDWKARLRSVVAGGELIVGAGAGTGLSAKCAEIGGADLIIIYNSGRFPMAGRGSLAGLMPYGDANAISKQTRHFKSIRPAPDRSEVMSAAGRRAQPTEVNDES